MGQILQKLSASSSFSNRRQEHSPRPSSTIRISRSEVQNLNRSPFRFLFIGETGAGKSSTIANLFQLVRLTKSQGTDFIQIWSRGDSLEVIELQGLLETGSLEDDAPSIAAFLIFLRDYFSREVPTLIFITARDSDNRFEGCSSNFTQVLQGVRLLLSEISDSKFSNVILLLSNGRGADTGQEIDLKISRYQAAFKEVIPVEQNVPCLAISKDSAVDDFRKILENKSQDFSPIREFLEYLDGPEGAASVAFTHEEKTLKEFKTDEFRSIQRKILNCVISGVFSNIDFFPSEDATVESKTADSVKDVVNFCINSSFQPMQGFEPVFEGAKILMADGSCRLINDCRVGDKVTSLSQKRGIVTAIVSFKAKGEPSDVEITKMEPYVKKQTENALKNLSVAGLRDSFRKRMFSGSDHEENRMSNINENKPTSVLYQTLIKRTEKANDTSKMYWTHDATIDRFALVSLKQETVTRKIDCLYFIQIDNGRGTFIADGIVRACFEHLN